MLNVVLLSFIDIDRIYCNEPAFLDQIPIFLDSFLLFSPSTCVYNDNLITSLSFFPLVQQLISSLFQPFLHFIRNCFF